MNNKFKTYNPTYDYLTDLAFSGVPYDYISFMLVHLPVYSLSPLAQVPSGYYDAKWKPLLIALHKLNVRPPL